MYAKIEISGTIEVITGMHIGGSSAFAAIGAVDSPIMKDVRTNLPMIPGSSLKGKMRALLAKRYNADVCEPNYDDIKVARLFGTSKIGTSKIGTSKEGNILHSRLIFSDMVLTNKDELRKEGLQSLTEVKFENSINRATAVANPRQIERAVRGSKFDLNLIYEVEKEAEILQDMRVIGEGFKLLQYDYLGGNGTRGYGKINFSDIELGVVVGDIESDLIDECQAVIMQEILK